RPFQKDDLDLLRRFALEPAFSAPFEWTGYRSPEDLRRRWEEDTLLIKDPRYLAVAEDDRPAMGWVIWRDASPVWGPPAGVFEIGIILAPEHRCRGVGSEAQRLLANHLFDTTTTHRLFALTEADNAAEQKALEKAGFKRE